jgi:hypothetical protein
LLKLAKKSLFYADGIAGKKGNKNKKISKKGLVSRAKNEHKKLLKSNKNQNYKKTTRRPANLRVKKTEKRPKK